MCASAIRSWKRSFTDEKQELTEKAIANVAKKLRLTRADEVYAEVGRGALRANHVVEAVFLELKQDASRRHLTYEDRKSRKPISIRWPDRRHLLFAGPVLPSFAGRPHRGPAHAGRGRRHPRTADCAELEKAQDRMDDWLDATLGPPARSRLGRRCRASPCG